jgi:hypothetical protein
MRKALLLKRGRRLLGSATAFYSAAQSCGFAGRFFEYKRVFIGAIDATADDAKSMLERQSLSCSNPHVDCDGKSIHRRDSTNEIFRKSPQIEGWVTKSGLSLRQRQALALVMR